MPFALSTSFALLPLLAAAGGSASPSPFPPKVAERLVGAALTDGLTFQRLEELTEGVGPRLSGSAGAERAVAWALQRLQKEGVRVHLEPVKVPHWVRGVEKGELLTGGVPRPLALTALGGSAGTPEAGVTGEVLEVHTLEEARALGDKARGKVLFFNHPMAVAADYGTYSGLRTRGASEASRLGAVAMVIRSLATASFRSPHTGATHFDDGVHPIPAAALSVEDAVALHRALGKGSVKLHLVLGCQTLPDADSSNVVAEIRGRERPGEIVVVGAHLDSWDLATGAHDDGAGVAMAMEVAHLLTGLQPAPRRTVRVVLFMNEENGLAGGKAYAAAHAAELVHHVAALEADSGGGKPLGVAVKLGTGGDAMLLPWLAPLEALGAHRIVEGEAGGADLSPMKEAQVPLLAIRQETSHYFDVHHSAADTLDKVSPEELSQSAAALAWLTFALADAPGVLPRPAAASEPPDPRPQAPRR